jgi:hypothetical protein
MLESGGPQKIVALPQSSAVFLFCIKIKLQTFSRRADSPTRFYFIISLADRQQQEGMNDLLLDLPVCDRASSGSAKKCEHTES